MYNLKSTYLLLGKVRTLLAGAVHQFAMLSVISGAANFSGEGLLNKDTDMQAIFFLDKHAVSQAIDMKHHFFQPERVDSPILLNPAPSGTVSYFNLYYNSDRQLYQAWVRIGSGIHYRESKDGINWVTPEGVENPVFSGKGKTKHSAVSYDPYDPDPSRRYKIPFVEDDDGAYIGFSPDGIHWRIGDGPSWNPISEPDTESHIYYNPFTEKWQVISRAVYVDRRIAMIETEDFKTWSDPIILIHPSPLDPIGMEFYGMPVYQYEDIFLGLLWKFQTGTSIKPSVRRNDGVIEPELTYSYNGLIWNRTFETLFERSQRGPNSGARIYPESIILNHEGGISLYSRGYRAEHGSANKKEIGKVVVLLHKMRKDGFAGFESIGIEGFLRTKTFVVKGDDLTLNVKAPYGSVKFQIIDAVGKPYPGFSFEDSVEWQGDDTAYRPQWKTKKDVSELVGKEVRFEIKMKEGILYAIRVPVNPGYMKPPMKRM